MSESDGKRYFTVKEIAELAGVSTSAMRAWERRFAFFSPHRTPGGHRLYDSEDVKLFWYIRRLQNEGRELREIALAGREKLLDEARRFYDEENEGVRMDEAASPCTAEKASHEQRTCSQICPPEKQRLCERHLAQRRQMEKSHYDAVVNALHFGHYARAVDKMHRLASICSDSLTFADAAMECMRLVGLAWERGEISIGGEHCLASVVRFHLLKLLYDVTDSTPRTDLPLAAFCTFPGEQHDLALLRAALFLKSAGWNILYFGQDLPLRSISEFVNFSRPSLVCMRASVCLSQTRVLGAVETLSAVNNLSTAFVLGGCGVDFLRNSAELPPNFHIISDMQELLALAKLRC